MRDVEPRPSADDVRLVEEVDRAFRSGPVSEVFIKDPLSQQCHDEIIMKLFQDLDPSTDATIAAIVFLCKFDSTKNQFVSLYEAQNSDLAREKVRRFGNVTPYSIANRAISLAAEIEEIEDSKEPVEKYRRIAEITQVAMQIYLDQIAQKSRQ